MRISGYVLATMLTVTGMAWAAPVRVNLQTELDSRRSKLGDLVVAKLERPLSVDGLTLPKGTLVLGHVQQVTKNDTRGRAEITLVFDHVKLNGGEPVPVTTTIVAVTASRLEQIPDPECGGSGLPELSDVHSITVSCQSVPRFRMLDRQDGTSGTIVRRASVRGPLTLDKGTLMDLAILPVSRP